MTNAIATKETLAGFDDLSVIVGLLSDPDETINLDAAKKLADMFDLALHLDYSSGHWFAGFKSRKGDTFLSDQQAMSMHAALWSACRLALDEVIERGAASMK